MLKPRAEIKPTEGIISRKRVGERRTRAMDTAKAEPKDTSRKGSKLLLATLTIQIARTVIQKEGIKGETNGMGTEEEEEDTVARQRDKEMSRQGTLDEDTDPLTDPGQTDPLLAPLFRPEC
ncbi:uncharacterized protein L3040_002602 [Drepanopeziza brunnea f. sp. 'multigermtubi']|uniref:uncharacterized protein n=1 Tax=Drepanopeziza brunnea f. sp. 'multigermtubi' TaxID=698441 RepID=UPI002389AB88|nr:hypothetical protein L3040_002602 [Drepanopeziza brunnea f. sp. 'multigermtubi']